MTEIDSCVSEKNAKGEALLRNLIDNVKQCQRRFGGKKEIATEDNEIVVKLCIIWEDVLCYGLLKTQSASSLLKNVQEIVYGNNDDFNLWDFCQTHLTKHEQERFNSLENITTKRGKLRALIRASLNERSLERYLYMWLGDLNIKKLYEPWALMLSPEAANLLPSIAAGLASILFSITIDSKTIDAIKALRKEPVIFAPAPVAPKKRINAVKRHILSSDDTESSNSGSLSSSDSKEIDKELNAVISEDEGFFNNSPLPILINSDNEKDDIIIETTFPPEEDGYFEAIIDNVIPDNGTNITSEISDISSIRSNSSFSNESTTTTNPNNLEEKLKEALERCAFLEARIAELSLENRRLTRHLGFDHKNSERFFISIPQIIIRNAGRKKFHVFQININFKNENENENWTIEKRYSEFYNLHQNMKRKNEFVKTLDFPPKKFGNLDATFLEERRQRLQIYLRHLLAMLPETSTCKTREELQRAFPFFEAV